MCEVPVQPELHVPIAAEEKEWLVGGGYRCAGAHHHSDQLGAPQCAKIIVVFKNKNVKVSNQTHFRDDNS